MNGINNPLLSICIPTWNRAKFLELSLNNLFEQIKEIPKGNIEIIVSDNCSSDNTPSIVDSFIKKGFPILYNRNNENIGAARNFLRTINLSNGKYILLLGDDDILKKNVLIKIVNRLKEKDYGLMFMHKFYDGQSEFIEYTNKDSFVKRISFWFTFMSGAIFRRDIVDKVDGEKYSKTHLLQMPYYIESALSEEVNILYNSDTLEIGLDSSNNGGFNVFEVFTQNYLRIFREYKIAGKISFKTFSFLKRDIFLHFLLTHIYEELFWRINIRKKNDLITNTSKNRKGYYIDGALKILIKEYYNTWYFYGTPIYIIYALIRYGKPKKK